VTTLVPSFLVGNYVFLTGLPILNGACTGLAPDILRDQRQRSVRSTNLNFGRRRLRRLPERRNNEAAAVGLKIVGFLHAGPSDAHSQSLRELGTVDELEDVVAKQAVRRIVVSMKDRRGKLPVETLLSLKNRGRLYRRSSGFLRIDFRPCAA